MIEWMIAISAASGALAGFVLLLGGLHVALLRGLARATRGLPAARVVRWARKGVSTRSPNDNRAP
jgi:hypothetical protein